MEKHYVTFEMTNGEKHSYEIDDMTKEDIFTMLVHSPAGWLELIENDEIHYLQAEKIVRVKVYSESAALKREEKLSEEFEVLRNIKF